MTQFENKIYTPKAYCNIFFVKTNQKWLYRRFVDFIVIIVVIFSCCRLAGRATTPAGRSGVSIFHPLHLDPVFILYRLNTATCKVKRRKRFTGNFLLIIATRKIISWKWYRYTPYIPLLEKSQSFVYLLRILKHWWQYNITGISSNLGFRKKNTVKMAKTISRLTKTKHHCLYKYCTYHFNSILVILTKNRYTLNKTIVL